MGFRPLHDWVLITRTEPEEMTSGGIIIPASARTKPVEGVVEAIGPGRFREEKGKKEKKFAPTVLRPGQHVMFIEYRATDVELDGKEITLIREDDILGTIEPTSKSDVRPSDEPSRALAIKKPYNVEVKKERPPMVQEAKGKVRAKGKVEAKDEVKEKDKTVKKTAKKIIKKAAARKTEKKTAVKKTATKKTAAKKSVKKTAAKKTAPKKTAAPKKTVVKKTVAGKTVKKTAAKKTASKRSVAKAKKKK